MKRFKHVVKGASASVTYLTFRVQDGVPVDVVEHTVPTFIFTTIPIGKGTERALNNTSDIREYMPGIRNTMKTKHGIVIN